MHLTENAVRKVREIAARENFIDQGIRIAVVGGGCSGYSYSVDFEDSKQENDFVLSFDDLEVFVAPMSFQYLNDTVVDYVESFQYSGFKFDNPNAKQTCGCGSSFSV